MSVAESTDALFQYVSSQNPPSDEDMEDFRGKVAEWFRLDEQIRKLQVAIKERRTHQRALSSSIQDFMISHGYDNLQTQRGKIVSKVSEVKVPLKIVNIREMIMANEGLTGGELVKKIFEAERQVVVKKSLRHQRPKVSFHLEL